MKIETINFQEFMAGTYRKSKQGTYRKSTRPTIAYAGVGFLPTTTVRGLFPLHDGGFALFLTSVSVITIAAFAEHFLARNGMPGAAQFIADVGRFVFPIVVYGSVLWLLLFGLKGL